MEYIGTLNVVTKHTCTVNVFYHLVAMLSEFG